MVAVRDQAGHNLDFPGTPQWQLGTTQKAYESSRTFSVPGTYTYWFAYRKGGQWTNLSPRRTFTVRASGTPAPSAPAPATPSTRPDPAGAPDPVGDQYGDPGTDLHRCQPGTRGSAGHLDVQVR